MTRPATGTALAEAEKITARQAEVLREAAAECNGDTWLRPMDLGGRDGSWHSYVLASLFAKGLVERNGGKGLGGCRPAWRYRITPKGRQVLKTAIKIGAFQ